MKSLNIVIISVVIVVSIGAIALAYQVNTGNTDFLGTITGQGSDDTGETGTGTTGTGASGGEAGTGTTGTGSGTGSGSGTGTGGSGSGTGTGGTSVKVSSSEAKSIASKYIEEEGCYAGTPKLKDGIYYIPVIDKNGNQVDSLSVDATTGKYLGRG